ncbi:hypothetical protein FCM35_KLT05072 [Carex littledalei]|uniref:Uncharacterized protein n=1 Tax=Carex littledalei TaxID=544730 RepID=A0A833V9G3_9POAL|nr:hypothetical protein FCM35_KLT05072 [Carex littledalei]
MTGKRGGSLGHPDNMRKDQWVVSFVFSSLVSLRMRWGRRQAERARQESRKRKKYGKLRDREREKRTVYTGRVQSKSARYWADLELGLFRTEPERAGSFFSRVRASQIWAFGYG